jgi:signal transduction histidine kinase
MTRTHIVPVVGLVLAIASGVSLVLLQSRSNQADHARLTLVQVENQMNYVQGIPWQVQNPRYGSPQQIHTMMEKTERGILLTLARLPDSASSSDVALSLALARANFAALETIYTMGLKPSGWNDPVPTIAVSQAENVSLAKTISMLDGAGKAYGHQADVANLTSMIAGVGAIALLFVGFLFYFRSSRRAARSQAGMLIAKHELNVHLSEALAALNASQEERSRLLERTVEVAEHERIRLSMNLHDGPIQKLTALAFNLDRLARRLDRGELADARALMGEVRISLTGEMEALRRLMVELRPPILDEGGLSAALKDAAERVLSDTATKWGVSCQIEKHQLAPELETVIYRVANEALVNARKHAHATRLDILVGSGGADTLRLVVADDGRGFDVDAVEERTAHGERYGLLGMEERVAGLGGTFHVTSRPGFGTRVEAFLPLKARVVEVLEHDLAVA